MTLKKTEYLCSDITWLQAKMNTVKLPARLKDMPQTHLAMKLFRIEKEKWTEGL